jgi:hypothetical protein
LYFALRQSLLVTTRGCRPQLKNSTRIWKERDTVVRFRAVHISVDGQEQSAIAVYWVTDGIDRCRVGFLRRHLVKHKEDYDGKLGQVVEIMGSSKDKAIRKKSYHYKGWATSVLIEVL